MGLKGVVGLDVVVEWDGVGLDDEVGLEGMFPVEDDDHNEELADLTGVVGLEGVLLVKAECDEDDDKLPVDNVAG